MPYEKITINLAKADAALYSAFVEIARRERVSVSKLGVLAIKEFVEKHGAGNPQRTLFPKFVELEVFPLEKRVQSLDWLKNLVACNPGLSEVFWCHKFSELAGLTPETTKKYIQTLLITGSLVRKGGKLYTKETVPAKGSP